MKSRLGRPRPTVLAGLVLLTALGAATVANASTVVLVRAPRPGPIAAEATIRLRGELVSAGFEVRVIDPPLDANIRASLEQAAAGPDVEAVVAILGEAFGEPLTDSAELWVIDRVTGKTVVRRVSTEPGSARAAEVLSIRALELLRASFLEVALAAGRAPKVIPQAPPVEVTRWTNAALDDRWRATWAIEVGGCVLGSLEGLTPSLVPIARLQRRFGDHFLARITLAGLGTPSRLQTPSGTVDVSQQFGLFEGALRWRVDKWIQPVLSVGAGALHVSATGQFSFPIEGRTNASWALVGDAGIGVRVPIRGRFEVAVEGHAQVARPYPMIRFFDEVVARAGRPTLISSLTLIAWM